MHRGSGLCVSCASYAVSAERYKQVAAFQASLGTVGLSKGGAPDGRRRGNRSRRGRGLVRWLDDCRFRSAGPQRGPRGFKWHGWRKSARLRSDPANGRDRGSTRRYSHDGNGLWRGPRARRRTRPSRWWRTIDKWTLSCVLLLFGIGLLLGLAASPPLAARNGLAPFHYVSGRPSSAGWRWSRCSLTSMMTPDAGAPAGRDRLPRRLRGAGAAAGLRHRFRQGRGALVFASASPRVQPSEFLKPGFVVVAAWLMAARAGARTARRGGSGPSR